MKKTGSIAIAALLLVVGSSAAVNGQQRDDRNKHDDRGHDNRGHDKKDHDKKDHDNRGHDNRGSRDGQISAQEQQQRIQIQEQRAAAYRAHLDGQTRLAQQQNAQLQQQRRMAQYRVQQQYLENLRQQQQYLRTQRDYRNDPYYSTGNTYRYNVGGVARQTNQYGADELRRAVNLGYQQGALAGQADRQDRGRADYRNSYAYRDANYGYNGNYVAQSDYNAYFREGFRRGYEDGYNTRTTYGNYNYNNNTGSILGNVLNTILGLTKLQ